MAALKYIASATSRVFKDGKIENQGKQLFRKKHWTHFPSSKMGPRGGGGGNVKRTHVGTLNSLGVAMAEAPTNGNGNGNSNINDKGNSTT
jgi:hypothetical protein